MRISAAAVERLGRIVDSLFVRPVQKRLHVVNERAMIEPMYSSVDRLVLVPLGALDDLTELARLAAERIPETDPLRTALLGSIGAVRAAALPEP